MDKRAFEHDSLQDLSSLAQYLQAVVDGFGQGKLSLAGGEKEIVLEPNGLIRFEVRASQRDDRARLSLRFTWKPKRSQDPQDENLRISAS